MDNYSHAVPSLPRFASYRFPSRVDGIFLALRSKVLTTDLLWHLRAVFPEFLYVALFMVNTFYQITFFQSGVYVHKIKALSQMLQNC